MSLRKKPWNRINLPVYSISSKDEAGNGNMNICTYVSAVSMQPKRMMLAVYNHTQTLHNVELGKPVVLQLLSKEQYNLVTLLGKQTGKKINKLQRLQKRKLVEEWNGFFILKDALAVMLLTLIVKLPAGDHCMFLYDVTAYKNLQEGEPLTLDELRQRKLIIA
jgi:flavin reductase (DIM6/NTAB) family NADH-FMN oxidoreductase RutF